LKQKSLPSVASGLLKSILTIEHLPSILPIAYPFPSPKHEIALVAYLSALSFTTIGS
jgi:hypothetical protein